jgi:hypothetical protein
MIQLKCKNWHFCVPLEEFLRIVINMYDDGKVNYSNNYCYILDVLIANISKTEQKKLLLPSINQSSS